MSRTSENSLVFGIGIIAGVLAGVAAGVMFSPKSGDEMRKDLKNSTENILKIKPKNDFYTPQKTTDILTKLQYSIEAQFNSLLKSIKAAKMASAKQKEEMGINNY